MQLNTVHVDPTTTGEPSLFTTSCSSGAVALWDLRKLKPGRAVASASHKNACQSAYFAPDGSRRIVSTSFDNTVRLWDGATDLSPVVSIPHNNKTGRWVLPFRAVWTSAGDGVLVGNMQRNVDVYSVATAKLVKQLQSPFMTAIPSRSCVHPTLPIVAASTASGRVHVYQ